MTLRLSIENMDRLPDGGPVRIEVKGRGLDFGRDAHLDWTLPDPSRTVSGKHCEVRFRDGGYWLHDVSTNGAFVNGAQFRLDGPYLLRNGDRISVGPYIIAVAVEGQAAAAPVVAASNRGAAPAGPAFVDPALADVWGAAGEAAAPDSRESWRAQRPRDLPADFLDFAAAVERPIAPAPAAGMDDWLTAPARPVSAPAPSHQVVAPPAPEVPQPRYAAPPAPPPPSGRRVAEASAAAPKSPVAPAPSPAPDLLLAIARAAGIPERAIAGRDPAELAAEIGGVIRLTAENLTQLLSSRAEAKTLMRSGSRTMIAARENNPLKFGATPEDALAIMFGPPSRQYLDARATVEQSFGDLKTHQILTYGAMQGALEALFEDLAPDQIDKSVEPERGFGAIVTPRKARLWDAYVERWRAKAKRADGRLFDAFTSLFAEAYDRLQKRNS